MHEFSLYGQVRRSQHETLRQQLAGFARMQPQPADEIHLIFKATPPLGLGSLPSSGGTQGVLSQDIQRIKTMLNTSLYFVQLVGRVSINDSSLLYDRQLNGDRPMQDSDRHQAPGVNWSLEFKDTPDPGKQAVSCRLISRIPLQSGNPALFLQQFGYEYISRYFVQGTKFYDQDTTIFLHRVLQLPQVDSTQEAVNIDKLPPIEKLQNFDSGQAYLLQVSVDIEDGNNPDLKEKATQQLLTLQESLKQAVDLTPGDRLALDTRVPVAPRRL